jgi:hypothetical protein
MSKFSRASNLVVFLSFCFLVLLVLPFSYVHADEINTDIQYDSLGRIKKIVRTSIVPYTYAWTPGAWGDCLSTTKTQTRSVECRRSDGVTVADSYCTGSKPASSQSCYKMIGSTTSSGANNVVEFYGLRLGKCKRGLATCTGNWTANPCTWTFSCSTNWTCNDSDFYEVNASFCSSCQ